MKIVVASLAAYPVKGLSPQSHDTVMLEAGSTFPLDRAHAFENGPSGFDAANPVHLSKSKFLCLARVPALAGVKSRLADDGVTLSLSAQGLEPVVADLSTAEGRAAAESFLTTIAGPAVLGAVRHCSAPSFSFSDTAKKVVSIINLTSVRALEKETGSRIDPIRFRGNILIDGAPAFAEHSWSGRMIAIGSTRLEGLEPIVRCAATEVNLETAMRDIAIPRILHGLTGAPDCGLYARVKTGGRIAIGDALTLL